MAHIFLLSSICKITHKLDQPKVVNIFIIPAKTKSAKLSRIATCLKSAKSKKKIFLFIV